VGTSSRNVGKEEPLRRLLKQFFYAGTSRFCPVCGRAARLFAPGGAPVRADAICVYCGALERHRLLWLFLTRKTDLFQGRSLRMLHIAPEPCLESRFKQLVGNGYLTADLFNPRAMIRMDMTAMQFADGSFDAVYCSHVLEHVHDDRQALREVYRVLKPGGWAILLVPIIRERTFEDPSLTTPEERLQAFGQEDHVRAYGFDYVERLREAGFVVNVTTVSELVNRAEARRMGLTAAAGAIYYCTKSDGRRATTT
jgi:SAM-dependent methyltransferase